VPETERTWIPPSAPAYLPEPPVMATTYGAYRAEGNQRLCGDLPAAERVRSDALRLLPRQRHGRAHRALMPHLAGALQQLFGEHDLITQGGLLGAKINETRFGDDGGHPYDAATGGGTGRGNGRAAIAHIPGARQRQLPDRRRPARQRQPGFHLDDRSGAAVTMVDIAARTGSALCCSSQAISVQ
jgi:hypothetical protein